MDAVQMVALQAEIARLVADAANPEPGWDCVSVSYQVAVNEKENLLWSNRMFMYLKWVDGRWVKYVHPDSTEDDEACDALKRLLVLMTEHNQGWDECIVDVAKDGRYRLTFWHGEPDRIASREEEDDARFKLYIPFETQPPNVEKPQR